MSVNAPEHGSGIYYTGTYWNDYPAVQAAIHRRLSGDPDTGWMMHFFRTTGSRPFRHALVLNCGNGHVERDLLRLGMVLKATSVDYAEDLLDEARAAALAENLPIAYHRMDTNTAAFPDGDYDLVVNSAAGHHIARIDRVFRKVCELLPDEGWFVSFDYVGPHRNQYPWDQWNAADEVNERAPAALKQVMSYPHLPTMLATDPTEAIHSELIVEMLTRYFEVRELRPLGGEIAYLLLTHNAALADAAVSTRDAWIEEVLAADEARLRTNPEGTLFAYAAAQPKKEVLKDVARLAGWAEEEDRRETAVADRDGMYYPLSLLQRLHLHTSSIQTQNDGLRHDMRRLESEVNSLRDQLVQSSMMPKLTRHALAELERRGRRLYRVGRRGVGRVRRRLRRTP
ncbi:MAG TPA: methyltransferase domain-containing protein [Acidimicrobiales bacterium]|nr:methyltransferase domain-containing protein [Acidimicrobiales bacterium]